ncbi:hypothetical protein BDV12DRAFT_116384 [Aspergillus spectabilis]
MHLNLAVLLSITTALASPLTMGVNHAKPPTMKMVQMSGNETIPMGHALVANRCEIPLYLWSVGENISQQAIIESGQVYSEIFRRDPKTGGIAIKITTVKDGLYTSAPQTVFAYNLVNDLVWYDLSDVFGDPFQGEIVSLLPSEPTISWDDGVPPSGSQVRVQDARTDLVLTVC